MAIRTGGRDDVSDSHVVWSHPTGGPYVCSPIHVNGRLYVITEQGILTAYRADTGKVIYRQRLEGSFVSSPVAAAGHVYFSHDAGVTHVVKEGDAFTLVASNSLEEQLLASPAIAHGSLIFRTKHHLHRVGP